MSDEARLGRKGVGGKDLCASGGGVRLTKLWNDGMDCSMPFSEDDDDPFCLRMGGRLRVCADCGLGILQAGVSPYMFAGFESTYMLVEMSKAWCMIGVLNGLGV